MSSWPNPPFPSNPSHSASYAYFRAQTHGQQLIGDVINAALRNFGVEAMMRVRTSEGLSPTGFYGTFMMENTRVRASAYFHSTNFLFVVSPFFLAPTTTAFCPLSRLACPQPCPFPHLAF
jgi:hypothetical protein